MMTNMNSTELRSALERVTDNYRRTLAGKPVRDVAETLAEADAALAQPTAEPPAQTAGQPAPQAAPLTYERIKALFQKYGTSRLEGFMAAILDAQAGAVQPAADALTDEQIRTLAYTDTSESLEAMCTLIADVRKAETNGEALGLVANFRYAERKSALRAIRGTAPKAAE